ncbi:CPSF A subunit region-domain-containing protein [Syncephalis fuscata]|nr:CPSF A subunit region-domain-containing protein [Syncephalis fuscata]
MYTLWKELVPPTAVEHAITAVLTAPQDSLPNLVICRDSILQIFSVQEKDELEIEEEDNGNDTHAHAAADVNEESGGTYIKLMPKNTRKTARLVLAHERRLHGVIASTSAIRTANSARLGRDSLLVAFKDAKMSLLEWCPETYSLITVSIHHYENDGYRREFLDNPLPLQLHVEPNHRCAVMPIYGTHLVILPFRQDIAINGEGSSKWPYSPSCVVPLTDIASDIKNILSLGFLNNFYEPTLALLYESAETWAGRLVERKDTCELVVVSLDVVNRKFPVIYRREHLPYDAHSIIPVPAPLGGVLVLTNSTIIYIDQGTPGVGTAINEYTAEITAFPHLNTNTAAKLNISLDGAQIVAFLSPVRALLALSTGELYLIELVQDGRSITDIHVGKVGASALASCGCRLGDQYVFLGSRMADALLIQYLEAEENKKQQKSVTRRTGQYMDLDIDLYGESIATTAVSGSNANTKNDNENIKVNGQDTSTLAKLYDFRVCDSLPAIGAITGMAVARSVTNMEDMEEKRDDRRLDVVMSTGYGKNGSLAIIRKSIRPADISEFELPGCRSLWTLRCQRERSSYCVLQDTHIIQVDVIDVRLLNAEAKLVQLVPFSKESSSSRIVSAQISDPYVLLISNMGRFAVLQVNATTSDLKLCQPLSLIKDRRVICGCICIDTTGQWKRWHQVASTTTTKSTEKTKSLSNTATAIRANNNSHINGDMDMDDIDMELYGHTTTTTTTTATASDEVAPSTDMELTEETSDVNVNHVTDTSLNPAPTTYWCMLYLEDGSLEVLALPTMEHVMTISRFDLAPTTLVDAFLNPKDTTPTTWPDATTQLQELLAVHFGLDQQDMHLMAVNRSGDVLVYRPFIANANDQADVAPNRLAIRFRRIPIESKFKAPHLSDYNLEGDKDDDQHERRQRLVPFHNINGCSGVFLLDQQYSAWLIYTPHQCMHLYPMLSPAVDSFTPFHNIHCSHGFLYYSQQTLHISQLPDGWNYDLPWPLRKVPLHRTVSRIAAHPPTEMVAVATSTPVPFHMKDEPVDPNYPPITQPMVGAHALELFTPVTWEQIDRFEFETNERVLCMKCTTLATNQTLTGKGEFIVVGTGYIWGEDISTKGRVYIFDVMEVVPEPDRPQKNHKLKLRCKEEVKGAVTVVDGIKGFLLTSVGRQVVLQDFEDTERLNGIGFLDTQIYLTSIACMKHLMLLGDLCKGVWFVGFQEEPPRVTLLGKDMGSLSVTCNEFIVDGSTVYFAVADTDGSMHLYSYSPYNVQSFNGQRLIRRGDIVLGSPARSMLRLPLADQHNKVNQTLCLCGLENGSVGVLKPVADKPYKRMQLLSARLIHGLQHLAGLNPKAYRTISAKHRMAYNPVRSILDGDLLTMYTLLPLARRREMAKQARTTDQQLMHDLFDVHCWSDTIF